MKCAHVKSITNKFCRALLPLLALLLWGTAVLGEPTGKVTWQARVDPERRVWIDIDNNSPAAIELTAIMVNFYDATGNLLAKGEIPCDENCLITASGSRTFGALTGPREWQKMEVENVWFVPLPEKRRDATELTRASGGPSPRDLIFRPGAEKTPTDLRGKIEEETLPVELGEVKLTISVRYPAVIVGYFFPALAHLLGNPVDRAPLHLVEMAITNHGGNAVTLLIKARIQGFSEWGKDTVVVPAGATLTCGLTPFFSEELSTLSEMRPGAIEWAVEDPGAKTLAAKTKRVVLASRNDMLLTEGFIDFLAVFVTPNDPLVSEVLSAARKLGYLGTFSGYQAGKPEAVYEQVRAVFDTLAALGLHYRSATTSYLSYLGSEGASLEVQKIYFPRESVTLSGANCLDGTVFLASCLEKLELRPIIVIVPGHAFLGVALTEEEDPEYFFVETTMLGLDSSGVSRYKQAAGFAGKLFMASEKKGAVTIVDITGCRKNGILPYPYYQKLTSQPADILRRLNLAP